MVDVFLYFDLFKIDEFKVISLDEIGKMISVFIIMSKNLKDMIK